MSAHPHPIGDWSGGQRTVYLRFRSNNQIVYIMSGNWGSILPLNMEGNEGLLSQSQGEESSEVLESLTNLFDPSQLERGITGGMIPDGPHHQDDPNLLVTPIKSAALHRLSMGSQSQLRSPVIVEEEDDELCSSAQSSRRVTPAPPPRAVFNRVSTPANPAHESSIGTVHIDYSVFVVQDLVLLEENTVKTKGRTGSGRLVPKQGERNEFTGAIASMTLPQFKNEVISTVNKNRSLVAKHMESIDKAGLLKWHAYILQDRTFAKNANHLLKTELDFSSFTKAAVEAGPKRVWCFLSTEDQKNKTKSDDAQKKAESLLVMRYGSANERESIAREQLRGQINPRGDQTAVPSPMEVILNKGGRMGAQWGVEKKIHINPRNPNEFLNLTMHRALIWAQAIEKKVPGVDENHPPNTDEFKYLPRSALHGTPVAKKVNNDVEKVPETPTMLGKRLRRELQPKRSPGKAPPHTPNKIADFLEFAQLDPQSSECCDLCEVLLEKDIYHWSFFLGKTEKDLLEVGFKAGPAAIIPHYIDAYHSYWQTKNLTDTASDKDLYGYVPALRNRHEREGHL